MKRPQTSLEIVADLKAKIADAQEMISGYQKKIADIEAALAKSRERKVEQRNSVAFDSQVTSASLPSRNSD